MTTTGGMSDGWDIELDDGPGPSPAVTSPATAYHRPDPPFNVPSAPVKLAGDNQDAADDRAHLDDVRPTAAAKAAFDLTVPEHDGWDGLDDSFSPVSPKAPVASPTQCAAYRGKNICVEPGQGMAGDQSTGHHFGEQADMGQENSNQDPQGPVSAESDSRIQGERRQNLSSVFQGPEKASGQPVGTGSQAPAIATEPDAWNISESPWPVDCLSDGILRAEDGNSVLPGHCVSVSMSSSCREDARGESGDHGECHEPSSHLTAESEGAHGSPRASFKEICSPCRARDREMPSHPVSATRGEASPYPPGKDTTMTTHQAEPVPHVTSTQEYTVPDGWDNDDSWSLSPTNESGPVQMAIQQSPSALLDTHSGKQIQSESSSMFFIAEASRSNKIPSQDERDSERTVSRSRLQPTGVERTPDSKGVGQFPISAPKGESEEKAMEVLVIPAAVAGDRASSSTVGSQSLSTAIARPSSGRNVAKEKEDWPSGASLDVHLADDDAEDDLTPKMLLDLTGDAEQSRHVNSRPRSPSPNPNLSPRTLEPAKTSSEAATQEGLGRQNTRVEELQHPGTPSCTRTKPSPHPRPSPILTDTPTTASPLPPATDDARVDSGAECQTNAEVVDSATVNSADRDHFPLPPQSLETSALPIQVLGGQPPQLPEPLVHQEVILADSRPVQSPTSGPPGFAATVHCEPSLCPLAGSSSDLSDALNSNAKETLEREKASVGSRRENSPDVATDYRHGRRVGVAQCLEKNTGAGVDLDINADAPKDADGHESRENGKTDFLGKSADPLLLHLSPTIRRLPDWKDVKYTGTSASPRSAAIEDVPAPDTAGTAAKTTDAPTDSSVSCQDPSGSVFCEVGVGTRRDDPPAGKRALVLEGNGPRLPTGEQIADGWDLEESHTAAPILDTHGSHKSSGQPKTGQGCIAEAGKTSSDEAPSARQPNTQGPGTNPESGLWKSNDCDLEETETLPCGGGPVPVDRAQRSRNVSPDSVSKKPGASPMALQQLRAAGGMASPSRSSVSVSTAESAFLGSNPILPGSKSPPEEASNYKTPLKWEEGWSSDDNDLGLDVWPADASSRVDVARVPRVRTTESHRHRARADQDDSVPNTVLHSHVPSGAAHGLPKNHPFVSDHRQKIQPPEGEGNWLGNVFKGVSSGMSNTAGRFGSALAGGIDKFYGVIDPEYQATGEHAAEMEKPGAELRHPSAQIAIAPGANSPRPPADTALATSTPHQTPGNQHDNMIGVGEPGTHALRMAAQTGGIVLSTIDKTFDFASDMIGSAVLGGLGYKAPKPEHDDFSEAQVQKPSPPSLPNLVDTGIDALENLGKRTMGVISDVRRKPPPQSPEYPEHRSPDVPRSGVRAAAAPSERAEPEALMTSSVVTRYQKSRYADLFDAMTEESAANKATRKRPTQPSPDSQPHTFEAQFKNAGGWRVLQDMRVLNLELERKLRSTLLPKGRHRPTEGLEHPARLLRDSSHGTGEDSETSLRRCLKALSLMDEEVDRRALAIFAPSKTLANATVVALETLQECSEHILLSAAERRLARGKRTNTEDIDSIAAAAGQILRIVFQQCFHVTRPSDLDESSEVRVRRILEEAGDTLALSTELLLLIKYTE